MITEGIEAARGSKAIALLNLTWQVLNQETMGVIGMYEEAAAFYGATQEEISAAIKRGKVPL